MYRRRIGSATSTNSSAYRIGSAKVGGESSSRKSSRCRPSSAPVTPVKHFNFAGKTTKKKTLEENSIHLKIEGKAIRSHVPLAAKRQQPLNRGAMKVYSNYRHPFYVPKKKGINLKQNGSRSKFDRKPQLEFSFLKDATNGITSELSDSISNWNDDNQAFIEHYAKHSQLENFFHIDSDLLSDDNRRSNKPVVNHNYLLNKYGPNVCNSYTSEDDDIEIRPTICLVSKPFSKCRKFNKITNNDKLRYSETESISNEDGSESTNVSLGQKIQQMASRNSNELLSIPDSCIESNTDSCFESNTGLNEEWKNLLQYNHNLLLNELITETNTDCSKHSSDGDENKGDSSSSDYSSDVEVISVKENSGTHSSVEKTGVKDNEKEISSLDNPLTPENENSFPMEMCSNHLTDISEKDESSERNSSTETKLTTIHDTNWEGKIKDITEASPEGKIEDVTKASQEGKTEEVDSKEKMSNGFINERREANNINAEQESYNISLKSYTPNKSLSTTDDLEMHETNQQKPSTVEISKPEESLFINHFSIPSRKFPMNRSGSILRALELIADEQNKDKEFTMEQTSHSDDSYNENNSSNSISKPDKEMDTKTSNSCYQLNLNHLIEKLLLFAQELQVRMDKENTKEVEKKELLPKLNKVENIIENICQKEGIKKNEKNELELHKECEERLNNCQKDLEERIHKNLELIRKLLDDKKLLTEKCEELSSSATRKEKCQADKIKLINEHHAVELKALREKLSAADQIRREKWAQHKTKLIKDSTYRGLETKIKDLMAQHREEITKLREDHWKELREKEESWIQKAKDDEQQLKVKYEKEKEEECKREREREEERYQHEIRQSEPVWQSRLEALQRQFSLSKIEKEEEIQRQIHRLKLDHESEERNLRKEMDSIKDEYEIKIRNMMRCHENEIASVKQSNDQAQSEWREQIFNDYELAKQRFEKELRERLRRQRDKEIEKAIMEIQQETTVQIEEKQRSYDQKLKNIRERYETELQDLEECEKISRSRYLEMKGLLTQREEEIIYLRARLHTQSMELKDFQQMFNTNE